MVSSNELKNSVELIKDSWTLEPVPWNSVGTVGRSNLQPLGERKPWRVVLKIMTSYGDDDLDCPADTRERGT